MSHRTKNRQNDSGGQRRIYPSFRTMAGQIIPPEDVPSHASPMFSGETQQWFGREITQLKRSHDLSFYTGL